MGTLVVGISDLKIAKPPDTLATYALGSCVGICLYDATVHLAGLSHIMLPTSSISPGDKHPMKFADLAIPSLVHQMELQGALRTRMKAKLAGGAQMFGGDGAATNPTWQIGQRNVHAVIEILHRMHIPILAQDVLDNYGRTVFFDPANGVMTVKSLSKELKVL